MLRARTVLAFTLALGIASALGCGNKNSSADAGATVTATPEVPDAGPTIIAPADPVDAGQDAAPAKPPGPGLSGTQVKVAACCNSLRQRAKELGTSPEATQIKSIAQQCDGVVKSLGNSGPAAPELVPLKAFLKTVNGVPAVCTGF